jgi:hypothetical protein
VPDSSSTTKIRLLQYVQEVGSKKAAIGCFKTNPKLVVLPTGGQDSDRRLTRMPLRALWLVKAIGTSPLHGLRAVKATRTASLTSHRAIFMRSSMWAITPATSSLPGRKSMLHKRAFLSWMKTIYFRRLLAGSPCTSTRGTSSQSTSPSTMARHLFLSNGSDANPWL